MELNCGKKAIVGTKGVSLATKLVPQVGEGSDPIKMLHKMMRRMLKRKIHPEVEGKRGQCCKKHEACEFVSLLQSQGIYNFTNILAPVIKTFTKSHDATTNLFRRILKRGLRYHCYFNTLSILSRKPFIPFYALQILKSHH